jgi:hypothetical protein
MPPVYARPSRSYGGGKVKVTFLHLATLASVPFLTGKLNNSNIYYLLILLPIGKVFYRPDVNYY